jgi:copper chaperone CopZ
VGGGELQNFCKEEAEMAATRIRELLGFKDKDDDDFSPAYPPGYPMQNNSMRRLDSRSKLPILELKVPMCCDKCQQKVKEELEGLEGIRSVECDQFNQRVTITGNVDPILALKRVKKVKKKSDFFLARMPHRPCVQPDGAKQLQQF